MHLCTIFPSAYRREDVLFQVELEVKMNLNVELQQFV